MKIFATFSTKELVDYFGQQIIRDFILISMFLIEKKEGNTRKKILSTLKMYLTFH